MLPAPKNLALEEVLWYKDSKNCPAEPNNNASFEVLWGGGPGATDLVINLGKIPRRNVVSVRQSSLTPPFLPSQGGIKLQQIKINWP
jgi:hypothetical protein